jgi:hypothetical protein
MEAAASFVVLKGYHMGSKWFAESFNRMPGGTFYFEYEHCLRQLGKSQGNASLASVHATTSFFQHACGCSEIACMGCAARKPPYGGDRRRALARHEPCMATGISFGALGAAYMAHLHALRRAHPWLQIVAHIRTNHVKHALSFLRTSCDGELNHMTPGVMAARRGGRNESSSALSSGVGVWRRLAIPPPLLLLRATVAAAEQSKVIEHARELSGGGNAVGQIPGDGASGGAGNSGDHGGGGGGGGGRGGVAYILRYESMQRDLPGEMRRMLHALGVAGSVASAATAAMVSPETAGTGGEGSAEALIKAGAENAKDTLSNYGAVEEYLLRAGMPCLHSMLTALGPVAFAARACELEIGRLSPHVREQMVAARDLHEGKLKLNATECGAMG